MEQPSYYIHQSDKTLLEDFVKQQRSFVVAIYKNIQKPSEFRFLNRPALQSLINKKELVGVEIGTERGYNAVDILTKLDIKKLYLIDPYLFTYDEQGKLVKDVAGAQKIKEEAINNLVPYRDKVDFLSLSSKDASEFIPNNIDFVYIDGDHSTEAVAIDIQLYFPKVRPGGIIGGHDANEKSVLKAIQNSSYFPSDAKIYISQCRDNRAKDWFFCKEHDGAITTHN